MFLRNFKILSKILLFIWILGIFSANVCLANDYHSCCPTQTSDWHMDIIQMVPSVKEVNCIENELCLVELTEKNTFQGQFLLSVGFEDFSPQLYLLTFVNHQINAPPRA